MWETLIKHAKQYLCPPGDGIHTVSTGVDYRHGLQKLIYKESQIKPTWQKSLDSLPAQSLPLLLGICSDAGGGILKGAAWGPLYIRQQLILNKQEKLYFDLGDVKVIPHLLHDKYLTSDTIKSCRKALYNDYQSTLPVSPLSITEEFLSKLYQLDINRRVFAIGGDHSCSYPTAKAFLEQKKKQGVKVALIHFDAHTDMLDERLGIDICFATWTKKVLPYLESPAHCIQLGIRASRHDRSHWESSVGVKQIWAQEILDNPQKIIEEISSALKALGPDELYISFDIDALDVRYASCTGTPEPGGIDLHTAVHIINHLATMYPITGADLMEVAPLTRGDVSGSNVSKQEPETTLMSAGAVATALLNCLGKTGSL